MSNNKGFKKYWCWFEIFSSQPFDELFGLTMNFVNKILYFCTLLLKHFNALVFNCSIQQLSKSELKIVRICWFSHPPKMSILPQHKSNHEATKELMGISRLHFPICCSCIATQAAGLITDLFYWSILEQFEHFEGRKALLGKSVDLFYTNCKQCNQHDPSLFKP